MKICFFILLLSSFSLFARTVLQIGDSQSQGIFGKTWHGKVKKDSIHDFVIYARGAGSVANWFDYSKLPGRFRKYDNNGKASDIAPTLLPSLETIFETAKADTIIIQLGGNMVHTSDTLVRKHVTQMLTLVKGHSQNCIWIGPPNGHARPQPRFGEFYKVLKLSVEAEGCVLVDSRNHTTYPAGQGDGIHFDSLGALGKKLVITWTDGIAKEILPLIN